MKYIIMGFSVSGFAKTENTGKVTNIYIDGKDPYVYFKLNNPSPAPCSTDGRYFLQIKNNVSNQNIFTGILSAKATNSNVTVIGRESCVRDAEQVDFLYIH
ncbi:hypothetical protein SBX64_16035 [Vibrio rhizosphaerae]|uniref:Uncharacterized protein n=1 Tax=Vibrio rhizosphaerae TaxID=398736 RepID=A0ABU4IXP6_9VIBR|nr:hypothetical protein [Vibrio rhizosphaerae]MDW6094049.1 hypothetical protein [Vibrio rhizosphaerae]